MQKLLKTQYFMNEMHEYEIKSFSTNLSLKTQTLNTFCIKIKEFLILDGHNKITHNIMSGV